MAPHTIPAFASTFTITIMNNRRMMLKLWCILVALQVLNCPVQSLTSNTTFSSNSTITRAPISTTETPKVTPATPLASNTEVPDIPVGTVAASSVTSSVVKEDTAYICSGDEVARLTTLNENNPYLQSSCSTLAGISSYVFPFNGELSFAQMVAMSAVDACGFYFRAVLLVQLQECVDANVYIRTTAETVLQLAGTSGAAPTEAEVNAAIAVRKTYNLALRDGGGAASYLDTNGASSLTWNIEGDTVDTTASATITGQLMLSTDLQVIGTYYASSASTSSTTSIEDSRPPSGVASSGLRREASSLVVALAVVCTALLLNRNNLQ